MIWRKEIESILNNQNMNGGPFWSRHDGDIHAPNGYSTIDTFRVLGELGATLKEYPMLSNAVEFMFQYQNSDGSFKYSSHSGKLPCITARILAALRTLGVNNDVRIDPCYQWLLDSQWSDGGWRCATVKLGKSSATDASNPGTTLYVLDAFRFRNNSIEETAQLDKAVDFLLEHWVTRLPLGPCDFGMGSRFFKIEYPFLRYNIFYYVYVLSFYEKARCDERYKAAYELILDKAENGDIILENPHRAWRSYDFARKGQVSRLAMRRWLEVVGRMQ